MEIVLPFFFVFWQFWRQNVKYSSKNLSQRMRISFAKKRSSSSSFATTTKAETTKEMTNTNNNTNDENNTNTNNSSSSKKSSSFTLPPSPNRETMFSFHCSATCSHGMLRCVFFTHNIFLLVYHELLFSVIIIIIQTTQGNRNVLEEAKRVVTTRAVDHA